MRHAAVPLPQATDEGEPPLTRPRVSGVGGIRKKAVTVRMWVVVDSVGHGHVLEAGKHDIMRRTGLPGRDLRMLDPVLSYPSIILGRGRAIVVNLEHIKSVITAQEVLFMNTTDPLISPFIRKLEAIFRHRQAVIRLAQEARVDGKNEEWANLRDLVEPEPEIVGSPPFYTRSLSTKNDDGNANREQQAAENQHTLKFLPFEFVALEACLEASCSFLDTQARTLEQEAYPALDKLSLKISTLNLESVRQIKSRLVAIAGRVQKVRDILEHLLDDDEDMAEMYLTDKFELQQQFESSPDSSINEGDGALNRTPDDISMEGHANSTISDGDEIHQNNDQQDQMAAKSNTFRRGSYRSQMLIRSDVQELEMILEAYFVQIDGTLNKLSTLREYVDDTEDYINMMLDDKQNHLLQMDVMLTTASMILSGFVVLTVVFGMNISIELFHKEKAGTTDFLWTIGGGMTVCVSLYAAAIAWCRHKRLLE